MCTRRWRRYRLCTVRKEINSTTIEKETEIDTQECFFLESTEISSSRIGNKSSTSPNSLSKKKTIYLADHRPEKNSDGYTEFILWCYLFCDGIISSAKLVHTCWITNLYVSTPNLPHSLIWFRLKQPNLVKKWYPSMSLRNTDNPFRPATRSNRSKKSIHMLSLSSSQRDDQNKFSGLEKWNWCQ